MDDSLAEKLKRLGMKLGADHIPPTTKPREDHSFPNVIPGEEVSTIHGVCYHVTKLLDSDHFHGLSKLMISNEIGLVADWAHTDHLRDQTVEDIIFLDTETSGLSGGTGTFPFLVGVYRQFSTGNEFKQFLLRDPSEEIAMLTSLSEYMTSAKAIVTYNGKSFDIPLLNNRYLMHGLSSPFVDLAHIDLLPLARKIWKKKLASRTLSNVETQILSVERSLDEVPGYLVPQVYFDYLKTGDARPLIGVLYHNEMDVLSLSTLLQYFINSFSDLETVDTQKNGETYPVIGLLLDIGETTKALRIFNYVFHPDSCSMDDDWEIIEKVAQYFRRIKDWQSAQNIWEAAAANGFEFGSFELAKYYEHHVVNYDEALYYSELLYGVISETNLPPYTKNRRLAEVQCRIDRINRKLNTRRKNLP